MFIVDEGLNEKFYKEMKWIWDDEDKNVKVHFLTKSIRKAQYTGVILFIDDQPLDVDELDDEDNNTINMVTITRRMSIKDIHAIYTAISEEYGTGKTSDTPTPGIVITNQSQSYIR